jgi:hypothetical protein
MIKHYGTKLWTKFRVNLYSVPKGSNEEFCSNSPAGIHHVVWRDDQAKFHHITLLLDVVIHAQALWN